MWYDWGSGLQPTRVQQTSPVRGSAVVEGSISLSAGDLPVPPQDAPSQPDSTGRHDGEKFIQNPLFKGQTWSLQIKDRFFRMSQSKSTRRESVWSSFHSESFHHTWAGKTSSNNSFASLRVLPATGNIISLTNNTFSQWDVSSGCVSVITWDYPSFWQRRREAAGLMWACLQRLGLPASVLTGKRDPAHGRGQNLISREASESLRPPWQWAQRNK